MGKTFRNFDKPKKKPSRPQASFQEDEDFGGSKRKGKFLPKYRKGKD